MPIDMYKGMISGWSEYKEGDEKHSPTHKLLSNKEYSDLRYKISKLENDIIKIKYDSQLEIENIKNKAEAENNILSDKFTDKSNEYEEKISNLKEKIEYQIKLNENLLRISRERSNVDRSLKPKKNHTGYVVLHSQQREQRFTDKNKKNSYRIVWETVIQSPYSIEFSEEQARIQIDNELMSENENWKIGDIGIDCAWYTDFAEIVADSDYGFKNIIFREFLRANYKVGYWEIVYIHTEPLGNVPKNMLPN